jgi:murein L,D-transpeptidase YcbB/YkuD
LIDVLRRTDEHGLRPADYILPLTASEIDAMSMGYASPAVQQRCEAALTWAASRFVHDLHRGRIDPRLAGFDLPPARMQFEAGVQVRRLASSTDLAATIASIEPTPQPYKRLKGALAQYRALARQPALAELPELPARSIARGDEYRGAAQLRRLLAALGDLPSAAVTHDPTDRRIDAPLADAVSNFQRRHGLTADGVIGPRTFLALTTPLSQRVRQIELSMERWRWLNALGRPDIVVNIPQFMLFALPNQDDPGAEVLEMRVIVGQSHARARTPIFTSEITEVVFQPYWDVPAGILHRELLPRIRRNPAYLDRFHFEIVRGPTDDAAVQAPTPDAIKGLADGRFRLRQRPGSDNALGPVKFVMRNEYNVYLHATPDTELFERAQRTFSHGCIRVSDPAALARYVLRAASEPWDDATIELALCGSETLRVALSKPVQVIVFYSTAVATSSGGLLFFPDVYGHDRELQDLLEAHQAIIDGSELELTQ